MVHSTIRGAAVMNILFGSAPQSYAAGFQPPRKPRTRAAWNRTEIVGDNAVSRRRLRSYCLHITRRSVSTLVRFRLATER
jgi:hypothetical protein